MDAASRRPAHLIGTIVLALTALGLVPSTAKAFEPVGAVHFTWGGSWYDHPTTKPRADEELGGSLMLGDRSWPVLPSAYYVESRRDYESDLDWDVSGVEVETRQVGVGIGRVWSWGSLQPYTAGGWVRTTSEMTPHPLLINTEESLDGAWLGAGVTYRVGPFLSAGVGGRFKVNVTEFEDTPVWSGAALLGVAWPAPE